MNLFTLFFIELGEKTIAETLIRNDFVYECIERFGRTPGSILIGGEENSFALNPSPAFEKLNVKEIKTTGNYIKIIENERIQKIEFFSKTLTGWDKRFLKKELNIYDFGRYAECCHKSSSKADAMDIVLDFLKIDKKNSIAIGDSLNDTDMLGNAGVAVAMGNSSASVKAIADFVSTSCDEGGVAYAIENLVLKK